mmetsp:Transcript_33864/g.95161  ORF Transcript_33864/g.95161 Transcript_33864/m.95161 type:complete len:211 (-) Transcript_33864:120-752(-)|eukprot:CAMPEP_0179234670 /NCGR_PEP_ID=MMETSP0797-20121207/13012_1 /TAXON_ID=47934 /ORGANISM="Dinophysis acuminata, Strain DAEP01" /LENGTH=210 /DNA_ID=CAMNT_0020941863 /DNA_START=91 /DNA_END=723 /DNA_ORIENTATION=+
MEERAIREALAGVASCHDEYSWASDNGVYMAQDDLLARQAAGEPIVIVDARDEDVAGGMIRGAMHLPDGSFDAESVMRVLRRAREISGPATAIPVTVVFHCMESVRRGPRCARGTRAGADALQHSAGCAAPPALSVRVLEGGFDRWVRRFWKDPERVEGFDDDYWGFAAEAVGEPGGAEEAAAGAPAHALYQRPADQPATPWSGPGSAVK